MATTDMTPDSKTITPADRREIRSLAWRGILLQASFNVERFQNLGYWWAMRPTLDRLYPDKEQRSLAYQRHLALFNTNPWSVGPILGVSAAMEKKRAAGATELDAEAINSVKVSMMAPMAGIGDSLVYGALRPVLSGVCAALAIQGNILGPIIFFVVLLAVQILMRGYGTSIGYRQGTRFFAAATTDQLDRLKESAMAVGMVVVGGLTATLLSVHTPLTYVNGDKTVALQDAIDQLLPAAIPLALTLAVFFILRRRVSAVWVLIGVTVVGLVGGFFGILA